MRKRADFIRARRGVRVNKSCFTLQRLPNELGFVRVGFTVTKKTGNAVQRNRIKRRLRAAASQLMPVHALPSHDYVLIARRRALTASFAVILDELRGALVEPRES